jgi:hypothetical protein
MQEARNLKRIGLIVLQLVALTMFVCLSYAVLSLLTIDKFVCSFQLRIFILPCS